MSYLRHFSSKISMDNVSSSSKILCIPLIYFYIMYRSTVWNVKRPVWISAITAVLQPYLRQRFKTYRLLTVYTITFFWPMLAELSTCQKKNNSSMDMFGSKIANRAPMVQNVPYNRLSIGINCGIMESIHNNQKIKIKYFYM